AAIEDKFGRLAGFLGIEGGYQGILDTILKLRADLDVPHTLAGLNVGDEKRDLIAEMAIVDPTAGGNPVKLTKEGALEIFDKALSGEV
ncbi:MAG: alcohol dehydrogenase, partial [Roseibium sp.]